MTAAAQEQPLPSHPTDCDEPRPGTKAAAALALCGQDAEGQGWI